MKYVIAAGLAALASPAKAEIRSYSCQMYEACRTSSGGCSPIDRVHEYYLDAETGEGRMVQEGSPFEGDVSTSGEATHFVFVNSTGIEMATVASGQVVFLGNMLIGDTIAHYRLMGNCTEIGASDTGGGGGTPGGGSK
ncbi:hypothetical protein [Alterinioella nitratireducens]|uniref:hypothetical protein n=1 Tax=Alterinioella nitratireducens TaxID=2735915 RepID=UPI004059C07D